MAKGKKPQPLTGKDAKNALMPEALEQAKKGLCATFNDVLQALESRGLDPFPLRLHATAADRDRIERLCRQTRETMFPKRR
jgi:hypothetical protein